MPIPHPSRRRALAVLAGALAGTAATGAEAPLRAPVPRPRDGGPPVEGAPLAIVARPVAVAQPGGRARLLAALALRADDPRFGGLSAIAVAPDGEGVTLLSDRALLVTGRLTRAGGALTGIADARAHGLRDLRGRPAPGLDSEGLARTPDGALWIAFEGDAPAVWRLATPGAQPTAAPAAPGFARLQRNSGLEALAADADGALYAIPERSGALDRPFPVHRLPPGAQAWDAETGAWPRLPPHLVTDAAVGPDGWLYVLERDASLLGGFAARVRRAPLAQRPDFRPQTVFDQRGGGLDNMEGIALWRAPDGLRMLLVSDDNFAFWQRSLLLEYALDPSSRDP